MEADHQAFREKVSEAVTEALAVAAEAGTDAAQRSARLYPIFSDFILPPPVDPLVEAISEALGEYLMPGAPWGEVRPAIAKHGLKIERTEA